MKTNNIVLIGDKAKDLFLHFLPGFQFKEFDQSNKFRFHKIRTQLEDGTINDFTLIVIDPSIEPGFPVSGIYSQRVGRTTSHLRCKFVICESDAIKRQSWMDDIVFRTNEKPTILTTASVQEALDPINKLLFNSPKSITPLGQCYSRQTFYYDSEATEFRKLISELDKDLILEDDVDLGNYGVFNVVISKVGAYSIDLQKSINDHLKPTKQYWVEIAYLHWFRFNRYKTSLDHKEDYHRVPSDFLLFHVFIPNAHFCSENQPLIDFLKDIQDKIPFVKFFRRPSIAGESSLPELKGRVPNVHVYVPPKHKQLLIDYLNERQIFYNHNNCLFF